MVSDERSCVTFRDFFRRDVNDSRVWFNGDEFAGMLDINGRKVCGLLLRHVNRDKTAPDTEGYTQGSAYLYVRGEGITGFKAHQSIRINGEVWNVEECESLLGSVWRVRLTENDG